MFVAQEHQGFMNISKSNPSVSLRFESVIMSTNLNLPWEQVHLTPILKQRRSDVGGMSFKKDFSSLTHRQKSTYV